jgi:hypothetical protein
VRVRVAISRVCCPTFEFSRSRKRAEARCSELGATKGWAPSLLRQDSFGEFIELDQRLITDGTRHDLAALLA